VKDQREPVSPDEFVLRAIPNNKECYRADLPVRILRSAFQAYRQDTTGLSVFRESCFPNPAAAPLILANVLPGHGNYHIVRLSVAALQQLGLTVMPDPQQDPPPGHALIPELGYIQYEKNRPKAKEVQLELAKLASAPGAIVFIPIASRQDA
jgi:hypothetical protein